MSLALVLSEALLVLVHLGVQFTGATPFKTTVAGYPEFHEGRETTGKGSCVHGSQSETLTQHPPLHFQYPCSLSHQRPPWQVQARVTTRVSPVIKNHNKCVLNSVAFSVNVNFTPEEKDEIGSAARWLRRVAHPFDSFEQILSVGLTPTASQQDGNQRRARNTLSYSDQL